MTTESAALAYVRKSLTASELVALLDAMCAAQDGEISMHLAVCSSLISEQIPDEPEDEPEPNNGRGEFDRSSAAMPLWMSLTGGQL